MIVVEQHDRVRRVVLNRPQKLNAMDPPMFAAFFEAIDAAVADPDTHAIIVAGAGRAFSSGADVSPDPAGPSQAARKSIGHAPADMAVTRARMTKWLDLWSISKPLIAQVQGYCIGAANEIVGCCDLVICGESARFGMPEVREFALPPALGFWPLRIGPARTKELLWTGRLVGGREAVELGLAQRVVPDEDLADETLQLASTIAEMPTDRLAVVKQAVNSWAETFGVRDAVTRGADYHALYHQTTTFGR